MNSKLPRHAHTCKPYLYGGTKGKVNRSDRINGLTTRGTGEVEGLVMTRILRVVVVKLLKSRS